MGGGVSKAELEKVQADFLTAQSDLKKSKEKQSSLEAELKAEYARAAKIKAENEEKGKQLKTEKTKVSQVEAENDLKEKRIKELILQIEELKEKLALEEAKSVQRVLNVAANLLVPNLRNDEDPTLAIDDGSDAMSGADSFEGDTKDAIAELVMASASANPLYDNLVAQIADLERKLEQEKVNTSTLGNQLMLRASSPVANTSIYDEGNETTTHQLSSSSQLGSLLKSRDYSVLVDASSSMRLCEKEFYGRSRWSLAQEALEILVPQVVSRDADGITLYFFSSGYRKLTHVNSEQMVKYAFRQEQPKGGTELALALADAVLPDNVGKASTILVISDGAPDNRKQVENVIKAAAAGLVNEDDIRIVFVQVGTDPTATRWLSRIHHHLKLKHDIVEMITTHELLKTGIPFAQWVGRSVMPDLLTNIDNMTITSHAQTR